MRGFTFISHSLLAISCSTCCISCNDSVNDGSIPLCEIGQCTFLLHFGTVSNNSELVKHLLVYLFVQQVELEEVHQKNYIFSCLFAGKVWRVGHDITQLDS